MSKCMAAMAATLLYGAVATAEVHVRNLSLGFPTQSEAARIIRSGAFAPALLELSLVNEDFKQVYARIELLDRDGDIVYSERMISLSSTGEEPSRQVWLYFVPNFSSSLRKPELSLQILDENRQLIPMTYQQGDAQWSGRKLVVERLPEVVDDHSYLVLSLGRGSGGRVQRLEDSGDPEQPPFTKEVRVAHIDPEMLPDHWHGLEMIDAIVWDAADPTMLSAQQQEALVEWVRQGGRLVLAAGGTADRLGAGPLAGCLPVEVTGIGRTRSLPELRGWLGGGVSDPAEHYPEELQIAEFKLKPAARALVKTAGGTAVHLAGRSFGNGSVHCLAVTLADLFTLEGDHQEFFRRILGLCKPDRNVTDQFGFGGYSDIHLFDHLHEPINFQRQVTAYISIAVLFVLAYGLVATVGNWFILKSRGMLKHSWSAFAAVAVLGSAASLMAVTVILGVGHDLHQLVVVDARAGSRSAVARCFFGVKTSSYVEDLDLRLVESAAADESTRTACYLRPLSPSGNVFAEGRRFADTRYYRMTTARAAVEDVPIRATLKQFEGYWLGSMLGQVLADVSVGAHPEFGSGTVLEGSTITNKLGHDLQNCFLLQGELPTTTYGQSRENNIRVHPLGHIPDNATVDLHRVLYYSSRTGQALRSSDVREQRRLFDAQGDWVKTLSSSLPRLGDALVKWQCAALLLTTFREYVPGANGPGAIHVSQSNARWLDRSLDVQPDSMLLVGFSDAPGPADLQARRGDRDFQKLHPSESVTVYRIAIPLTTGN